MDTDAERQRLDEQLGEYVRRKRMEVVCCEMSLCDAPAAWLLECDGEAKAICDRCKGLLSDWKHPHTITPLVDAGSVG